MDGEIVYPETFCHLPLVEPEEKPTLLDVFPECPGLKIGFLSFQCFKLHGHELQKGNAEMNKYLRLELEMYL